MPQPITPAIVRDYSDVDADVDVLRTPFDSVSHRRGWGDTGSRVELVSHACPECGFDRMIRRTDVKVEFPDEVRYWCLYPNCVHFIRDELSAKFHGSYPNRTASEPAVME